MSFTGVDSLDTSISKSNAWLADIDTAFGTKDRRLAYRVLRAWLHSLRDGLSVDLAANFAAQLPELLRGVFFEGWNPSRVPHKHDRNEFIGRFARDAQIRDSDVTKSARVVTAVARQHMSAGGVAHALDHLPAGVREMLEPELAESAAGQRRA